LLSLQGRCPWLYYDARSGLQTALKLQAALPNCKITVDEPIQKAIDALRGKK
jgi:hypothetical protein